MPHTRIQTLKTKHLERAKRLRQIWDRKRGELGITQMDAARLLGWKTQGAVGHVLSGSSPLTLDLLIEFSHILQVPPQEIVPELEEVLAYPPSETPAHTARRAPTQIDKLDLSMLVRCVHAVEQAAQVHQIKLDCHKQNKLVEFVYAELSAGKQPEEDADKLANRLVEIAALG